jgi:hypothetical protein|tara:strand:- start:609 stop:1247 length:639 start_codon:yes stop_codon:yes gene_type:complete
MGGLTSFAKKKLKKKVKDDLAFDEAQAYGDALRAKKGLNKKAAKKAVPEDSGDISEVVFRKDRKPSPAKKQTSKERLINATGAISAMLTKAGPKPLSMDKYRSLPTNARNAFGRQAKSDYDNKFISKSEYETIIERIEAAELKKNVIALQQGIANKKAKPVTIDKSMGVSEKDMPRKPIKLSKGGMSKKRMSYNKGGYVNCGASMPATQGKK